MPFERLVYFKDSTNWYSKYCYKYKSTDRRHLWCNIHDSAQPSGADLYAVCECEQQFRSTDYDVNVDLMSPFLLLFYCVQTNDDDDYDEYLITKNLSVWRKIWAGIGILLTL